MARRERTGLQFRVDDAALTVLDGGTEGPAERLCHMSGQDARGRRDDPGRQKGGASEGTSTVGDEDTFP